MQIIIWIKINNIKNVAKIIIKILSVFIPNYQMHSTCNWHLN